MKLPDVGPGYRWTVGEDVQPYGEYGSYLVVKVSLISDVEVKKLFGRGFKMKSVVVDSQFISKGDYMKSKSPEIVVMDLAARIVERKKDRDRYLVRGTALYGEYPSGSGTEKS